MLFWLSRFWSLWWSGNKVHVFPLKNQYQNISNPKYLKHVLVTLLNQSMTSKNTKKEKKNTSNSKIKNFPNSNMIFRHFQSEKHLVWTPLIICNNLTQKSNVLVVKIVANDKFIYLYWNPASPSNLVKPINDFWKYKKKTSQNKK